MRSLVLTFLLAACGGVGGKLKSDCQQSRDCQAGLTCVRGVCAHPEASLPSVEAAPAPPPTVVAATTPPQVSFAAQPPDPMFMGEVVALTVDVAQGDPADALVKWKGHYGTEADAALAASGPTATVLLDRVGVYSVTATATGTGGSASASLTINVGTDEVAIPLQLTASVDGQSSGLFAVRTDGGMSRLTPSTDLQGFRYGGLHRAFGGSHVCVAPSGGDFNVRRMISASHSDTLLLPFPMLTNQFSCDVPKAPTGAAGSNTCTQLPRINVSRDGRYLVVSPGILSGAAPTGITSSGVSLLQAFGGPVSRYDLQAGGVAAVTASKRVISSNVPPAGAFEVWNDTAPEYMTNGADISSSGDTILVSILDGFDLTNGTTGTLELVDISSAGSYAVAASGHLAGHLFANPRLAAGNRAVYMDSYFLAPPPLPGGAMRVVVSGPDLQPLHQTILVSGSSDPAYSEYNSLTGPTAPSFCLDQKAVGQQGISLAVNTEYELSPDGRLVVVYQGAGVWTDCSTIDLTNAPRYRHRLFVHDLDTGNEADVLPLPDVPVEGNFTLGLTQFVANGRQIVFAKQAVNAAGDAPAQLFVVNVDRGHRNERRILGAQAVTGNAVLHSFLTSRFNCSSGDGSLAWLLMLAGWLRRWTKTRGG